MTFEPFFMQGSAGRLFALFVAPDEPATRGVVYCPPFAEEANRARRTVVLCARRLAEEGVAVLLVDPFGCGDSEGEFGQARWDIWLDDVSVALEWLERKGVERMGLLGFRLGASLACDFATKLSSPLERLILWQPVIKGRNYLTQFLRLRSAHDMIASGSGVPTSELRDILAAGESLEIAGYDLSSSLSSSIDELDLKDTNIAKVSAISWLEVQAANREGLARPSAAVVETWTAGGARVDSQAVADERVWETQEITIAPALIDATVESFRRAC